MAPLTGVQFAVLVIGDFDTLSAKWPTRKQRSKQKERRKEMQEKANLNSTLLGDPQYPFPDFSLVSLQNDQLGWDTCMQHAPCPTPFVCTRGMRRDSTVVPQRSLFKFDHWWILPQLLLAVALATSSYLVYCGITKSPLRWGPIGTWPQPIPPP
jgi:hypothetical protein